MLTDQQNDIVFQIHQRYDQYRVDSRALNEGHVAAATALTTTAQVEIRSLVQQFLSTGALVTDLPLFVQEDAALIPPPINDVVTPVDDETP